jgi:hypothetical protein
LELGIWPDKTKSDLFGLKGATIIAATRVLAEVSLHYDQCVSYSCNIIALLLIT